MRKNYSFIVKLASKVYSIAHLLFIFVSKRVIVITRHLHHHTARRPHNYFMNKSHHYRRWHSWDKHQHVHFGILGAYVVSIGFLLFTTYSNTQALSDLTDTWNFSTPADYTIDNGLEFNVNSVRMKAQEYTSDPNTAALFHFNETSGTSVGDSSSNANNGTTTGNPAWTSGALSNALSLNGTTQYASIPDSPSLSLGSQQSVEGWMKPNATFNNTASSYQTIFDKGSSKMYLDNTTGKLAYEVQNSSSNTWTRTTDSRGQNGGWNTEVLPVEAQATYGSDIYVSTSLAAGAGDVWRRSGTTWTKVGGDGVNNSWTSLTYEGVYTLAVWGTDLYAGLGVNGGDGEVWRCSLTSNCSSWTKVGGDGVGPTAAHEAVRKLLVHSGALFAATGDGAGDGDVYRYDGTNWTQIGGDALNSGWASGTYEKVETLTSDGTYLYAGLGTTAGDAEVWRWNGTAWTRIGGDAINSSWANATYESVFSLTAYGGNLYAGLGTTAGDGEVWRWNGSTWTLIGGDAVNSSWANSTYESVQSLTNDGTNLYVGLGLSTGDGEVWRWNGSTWTKIGGDSVNNGFTASTVQSLYYDTTNSRLLAGVYTSVAGTEWSFDGSNWTMLGGAGMNNSWSPYNMGTVTSMASHEGKQYVGLSASQGTALVYEYNGSSYQLIGGNGTNNSWSYGDAGIFESVTSMISFNGQLYVGLGQTGGDGEVWRWDGSTWTKVGGDGVNSSWGSGNNVTSFTVWNGKLYATVIGGGTAGFIFEYNGSTWVNRAGGTGNINGMVNGAYSGPLSITEYSDKICAGFGTSANQADVWCWNGSGNWTQVGGDGINGSWNSADSGVYSLGVYSGKLIAGTGDDSNRDPSIWSYNGTSWTRIGGNSVNSSWVDGNYYRVLSLAVYNGELFAGFGYGSNNGHVWKWNDSSWQQVGGDSLNGGWSSTIESVRALNVYKGKLYGGMGDSASVDAQIYSYRNNAYVESATSSFDANWQHIAGTFNGSTMKLYINGAEDASVTTSATAVDTSLPLLIGTSYGGYRDGVGDGKFNGSLDELRFSNTARSSFTSKPYASTEQIITLNNAIRKSGVWHWDSFSASETLNGGTITYRLSSDDGATWKYWDGAQWATSSSTAQANTQAMVSSNILSFPVTFDGIKWQAILKSNGDQQVQLNTVTIEATSDVNTPVSNASSISALKALVGSPLTANAWTNGSSPYFSWSAGSDNESGIKGYCLYLGTDNTADPVTTKGILGSSPLASGGNCQFLTNNLNADMATSGYIATAMVTDNSPYYLRIKALDNAGNASTSATQFAFRFDNTPPSNPGFITAPSGFVNNKDVTLTWPSSGGNAPSDSHSGLAGLQYKIGNTLWYGDAHTGTGDNSDLLANDGSYTTQDPPDYANLVDGINTVYFRTWDTAGNVTTSSVSAAIKLNTSGAPSEPQSVIANPSTNTTNSFAFNWDPPVTYVGNENNITYCYTINALPSASNCTYTPAGVTSLGAGPYATQPGANTLYVVAKDESNNINYANYASATFTANTPSPGIPLNVDIVDVSIKSTNNWRLAVTWDEPSSVGAGIASYRVYRSTALNGSYSLIGSSSSTTYIDAGLTQQIYYYKIRACDSANNCGAESTIVSKLPTGKYTSPATITSEPEVSSVTTKRATIKWTTDRPSDSKIAIGTASGSYSPSEIGNSDQTTAHTIDLDNLAAGTTYYYVAKWTDEDGNTGTTQEYSFKTSPAPSLLEVSADKIGLSTATISFTSKEAHKIDVLYGQSQSFGGIITINTSPNESTYSTTLDNLLDGTKYFFKLITYDKEGYSYDGSTYSFTTPSRPKISNLRFQPVAGEPTSTQQVTWNTNVPATSLITYTRLNGDTKTAQNLELKTDHSLIIKDLVDDSDYSLIAESRDGNGNLATSDKQTFRTALDTRPPKAFDVSIESAIRGVGSEARGQIIVSWKTDEPSTSQVGYSEGSSATVFNNKTVEDSDLSTEHVVVISDLPTSRVYSVQPISRDKSNNQAVAPTQSAIIGRASDDVLTIVFNTLRRVFGY